MSGLDTSLIGVTNTFDVGDANYRAAQNNLLQQKVNEGNNTRNRQSDIYKALMNKPQGVSPGKHLIDLGYADEGLALEKQQSEINKQNISNKDDEINSHIKSINIANMAMREMLAYPQLNKNIIKSVIDNYHNNGLTSPEIYQKQIAELPNIPDDDAGIRSFIEGQTQSLMKAEDYYKQNHLSAYEKAQVENQAKGHDLQARGYDIQEQGQGITQQNNLANQGFEGERIKLNRDDKSFEQSYKRGQQNLDNKKYDLEVKKQQANPTGKAPTEFQGKSATYAARAQEAETILSSLNDSEGSPKYSTVGIATKESASKTPLVGGILGAAGNAMLSDDSQKAEQAQRNFINAILRQESGATISPSEFDNARKQYFPQPGDSKGTLEQKANNRRTVIESLKNNAGNAMHGGAESWSKPNDWEQFLKETQ